MDEPEHILHDLRAGVTTALERAEERMSHVQRQLAGWTPLSRPKAPSDPGDGGWQELETRADSIAGDVDADLVRAQVELGNFLHQARELAASLQVKPGS
jgi:hypothetical protein